MTQTVGRSGNLTTQEVKSILKSARTAGLDYLSSQRQYKFREGSLVCGKAIVYYNTGASHERAGNATERALCSMADCGTESDANKKAFEKAYCDASRLIYLIKDDRERQVLDLYYLHCKSWAQVAAKLGTSTRQVHRLHGKLLKYISENA